MWLDDSGIIPFTAPFTKTILMFMPAYVTAFLHTNKWTAFDRSLYCDKLHVNASSNQNLTVENILTVR